MEPTPAEAAALAAAGGKKGNKGKKGTTVSLAAFQAGGGKLFLFFKRKTRSKPNPPPLTLSFSLFPKHSRPVGTPAVGRPPHQLLGRRGGRSRPASHGSLVVLWLSRYFPFFWKKKFFFDMRIGKTRRRRRRPRPLVASETVVAIAAATIAAIVVENVVGMVATAATAVSVPRAPSSPRTSSPTAPPTRPTSATCRSTPLRALSRSFSRAPRSRVHASPSTVRPRSPRALATLSLRTSTPSPKVRKAQEDQVAHVFFFFFF